MKIKKILFLLVLTFTLIYVKSVNAASVSGYNTYYIQQTSNGTLPDNYSSTVSGLSFPTTTYTQLGPYQNQSYNVIRAMDLQFPSVEFTVGSTYTFTINFDYGSYIYPNWPNNQAHPFSVRSCPHGTCSITYTWQNDSTHQSVNTLQLKLVHKANANQTGKTFGIGPMTTNTGLFYNAYSSQQGIRINSATVDIVEDPNYQNTQDIINNNNQNTQTIINNQNENTQKEIESQKVCQNVTYTFDNSNTSGLSCGYLGSSGSIIGSDCNYHVTDYLSVLEGSWNLTAPFSNQYLHYCLYDSNRTLLSCHNYINNSRSITLPITITDEKFIRFTTHVNGPSILNGKLCKNGNQALNDTLTDDNLPDVIHSGGGGGTYFDDINGSSDTPISDLLLLPLNLYNKIKTNLQTQCTPYTIPFDFTGGNNTLTFPCLNLEQHLGSNLWSIIDGLFCIFMIYNIFNLCISTYDSITNLDDLFPIFHGSSFYSGRHEPGKYEPRHGGD